jgi:hypothetical protein
VVGGHSERCCSEVGAVAARGREGGERRGTAGHSGRCGLEGRAQRAKAGHSERCCSEGGAVAARGGGSWLLPLDHSGSQRCSGFLEGRR